ncbi:hypothetical protein K3495_g3534 [Podosphaera aphanis]|nr:hypothetical protein K3495_g3534 [Podosphaera aphanis]
MTFIEDFTPFIKRIENQYGIILKKVFSDNGGEYIDKRVEQFLDEYSIDHDYSPSHEHESNGAAERLNRTIVTKARALIINFPKFLWAEAIATSVYLYNRTPHRMINYQSPIELIEGVTTSTIEHLHAFGCKVYVHIPDETRPSGSKLQPRAIEGIFVGYTGSSKLFRIYIPSKRIVQIIRQVYFSDVKPGEVLINVPVSSISEPSVAKTPSTQPSSVTNPTINPIPSIIL